MIAEPRVRRDGRCVVCMKPRKMPRTHHRTIPRELYESDPFCSGICARLYFGNPMPIAGPSSRDLDERRGKHVRAAA